MIRFTLRQLAATTVLVASTAIVPTMAGEAPAATADAPRAYVIPKKIPEAIRKAVENPARPKADVARDADRRPAEIMYLAGLRPGSKVLEFGSIGNYYTRMLSDVVGAKGQVNMIDLANTEEQFGKAGREFAASHPNTTYTVGDYYKIEFPRNVDVAFMVLYFHELLLTGTDLSVFHSKLYKSMRPGAIYFIVDHNAKLQTGTDFTAQLHRIDPATIRANVQAAGFELIEDSRILENLSDDHTWPVYTAGKRDKTDQTVYVFRKPISGS